jgi:hypothetical protein
MGMDTDILVSLLWVEHAWRAGLRRSRILVVAVSGPGPSNPPYVTRFTARTYFHFGQVSYRDIASK